MKKNKTILLFEPWHFGDMVIAAGIARSLKKYGFDVALVYDPKWDEWIRQQPFIDHFLPVKIPWTVRNFADKYSPGKYFYSFWRNIFSLKKVKPDVVVDVRGDIRHKFLLRLIFPFKKIISLPHERRINVYDKSLTLFKALGIPVEKERTDDSAYSITGKPYIILFFGANDPNRELPPGKINEFLSAIKDLDIKINLILKPGEDASQWINLSSQFKSGQFGYLQGSLSYISAGIQKASIVISTDSGWLHAAKFYHKKIIGLYAFDTISAWAPPGIKTIKPDSYLDAKYKYRKRAQHQQPLKDLDIQLLKNALIELLEESNYKSRIANTIR